MTIPYAVLDIENNLIQSFHEKPTYTYHANGGIYLFKKDVLNNISFNKFFNATDLIDILIKQGKKVYSYTHVGYWLDIGSPQDFEKAKIEINNIIF
jgi:NDP-sugar pyrophosphorylase family protein